MIFRQIQKIDFSGVSGMAAGPLSAAPRQRLQGVLDSKATFLHNSLHKSSAWLGGEASPPSADDRHDRRTTHHLAKLTFQKRILFFITFWHVI